MSRSSALVSIFALAALTLVAPEAMAGPGDTTQLKGRVGVDTGLFGFGHFNPDGGPADDGTNFIGFGVGRSIGPQNGIVQPAPLVGVHGGALILGGNALIGGRVTFSLLATRPENEDAGRGSTFNGELIPYFRYMFMQGSWVRPYVEGHFGFGGGVVSTTAEILPGEEVTSRSHVISPVVGAAGGAMLFLNEHVSIDLGLNFDYLAPHTRVSIKDPPPEAERDDWEKAGDLISLEVILGISGWF